MVSSDACADRFDVLVIGAGFGGLGAALTLAERGARVVVCESLRYAGGCASTFSRSGYRFESGATLFSGLAEDQLFGRWIKKHDLDVVIDWIDPLVELRTSSIVLSVHRERDKLIEALTGLPGAPEASIRSFFKFQQKIADTLWSLFDDPALLPPLSMSSMLRHLMKVPHYAPLLPLIGRPLQYVLKSYNLDNFAPLMHYLDALCQITVQCDAASAEASFALATMDYYFRGTGHVRGGIGELAAGLVKAIEQLGGEVRFANRVKALQQDPAGYRAETRKGEIVAQYVVANVLPQDLRALLGISQGVLPRLDELSSAVQAGWGAVMLYLVANAPADAPDKPIHLEIVDDPNKSFVDGNHVFVSISGPHDAGRCPLGQRTLTCSTHVSLAELRGLSEEARGECIARIQARMRETLAKRAPEWVEGVVFSMTASPRTFERFTGRSEGAVGGIPRRAGLSHYGAIWPQAVLPGLYLVGDSVFPGQSTLATAVGGQRVAEVLLRAMR